MNQEYCSFCGYVGEVNSTKLKTEDEFIVEKSCGKCGKTIAVLQYPVKSVLEEFRSKHPDTKIIVAKEKTICEFCNEEIYENVCKREDSFCVISCCPKCGRMLWIT